MATTIAYTFTLTDGSELHTDPQGVGVIPDATTDLEVEDNALAVLDDTIRRTSGGLFRCNVAGHRRGVALEHVLHVGVEVTR